MKLSLNSRFAAVLLILSVSSCEHQLLKENFDNTPLGNYEVFCSDFDHLYGAFEAKKLNWDSLKVAYRSGLDEPSSYAALYSSLTGLLHHLNDGHADLSAPGQGNFRSWNRRGKPYFIGKEGTSLGDVGYLQNMIRNTYLKGNFRSGNYSGWLFFWGTIEHAGRKTGYICIPTFSISNYPHAFIQEAIDSFNQLQSLVIDLRFNSGGTTEAFVGSLNSFASEKKTYMWSRFRNGKGRNDFTPLAPHRTSPHKDGLKKMPVAILQNSYSASSSDHFILGMRSQANVFTLGDTTCGAFSSVLERILPNGWKYRLGAQEVYDAEGRLLTDSKGRYLEGTGIAPDYFVPDRWTSVQNKKDDVLDKALQELEIRLP